MFDSPVIFLTGGITKFVSHSFATFSICCLYKMILHVNFLSSTFSLLYFIIIIIYFLVFEPYIALLYQYLMLPR